MTCFFGAVLFRYASSVFAYVFVAGLDLRLLQGICHLLLHGFTFPTTSHIFILRGFCPIASREVKIGT